MIRVLLVDDHAIVRKGMRQILELTEDVTIIGEAENGERALELIQENEMDVVLMDMTMPGLSGIELIAQIKIHNSKLPVLVLSMHRETQITRCAIKAGASGYLTKDSEPETILDAIRAVAAGRNFIDQSIAVRLAYDSHTPNDKVLHEQLSEREFDILQMLAQGKTVNDIAAGFAISNKTVSTHKARLMRKMGMASNAELIKYALEQGLMQ